MRAGRSLGGRGDRKFLWRSLGARSKCARDGRNAPTDGGRESPVDGGWEPPVEGGREAPVDGGRDVPVDGVYREAGPCGWSVVDRCSASPHPTGVEGAWLGCCDLDRGRPTVGGASTPTRPEASRVRARAGEGDVVVAKPADFHELVDRLSTAGGAGVAAGGGRVGAGGGGVGAGPPNSAEKICPVDEKRRNFAASASDDRRAFSASI